MTNDQIIVEFKNAAEVAMRLKAYAETSKIGGLYTEAACAYEASDTIIRLIGIIAGMATPKQPTTSFVDKNYCGHCGKSFKSMIPGSRCRTPACEAGKYWDKQKEAPKT